MNRFRDENFERILLESIDQAFDALGDGVKKSIYFHLEHRFMIARKDVPFRIGEFSDALERIFGLGARHLEILFMKNLHAKVKAACEYSKCEWSLSKWIVPEMTFKEYVYLVRQSFEAANMSNLQMGDSCK